MMRVRCDVKDCVAEADVPDEYGVQLESGSVLLCYDLPTDWTRTFERAPVATYRCPSHKEKA